MVDAHEINASTATEIFSCQVVPTTLASFTAVQNGADLIMELICQQRSDAASNAQEQISALTQEFSKYHTAHENCHSAEQAQLSAARREVSDLKARLAKYERPGSEARGAGPHLPHTNIAFDAITQERNYLSSQLMLSEKHSAALITELDVLKKWGAEFKATLQNYGISYEGDGSLHLGEGWQAFLAEFGQNSTSPMTPERLKITLVMVSTKLQTDRLSLERLESGLRSASLERASLVNGYQTRIASLQNEIASLQDRFARQEHRNHIMPPPPIHLTAPLDSGPQLDSLQSNIPRDTQGRYLPESRDSNDSNLQHPPNNLHFQQGMEKTPVQIKKESTTI